MKICSLPCFFIFRTFALAFSMNTVCWFSSLILTNHPSEVSETRDWSGALLSSCAAGQQVGIKEMEDGIWVVSFLDFDLGYFDDKSKKVEPVEDPFGMLKV
jgi:hypothetical protein